MPHVAGGFLVLDLEVGDRRLEHRVPVHQPLAAVDQPFLVERHEHFEDGFGQALVHGEALAAPVGRGAQPLQLVDDRTARLRFPGPHPVDELLASEVAAADAALRELALDHHLGGDAGMVHARLPQHVLAAHALEADEDVLQRVVERVTHVQRAGDVGRRDDDGEGFRARLGASAGPEGVGLLPALGDLGFDGGCVVGLVEHRIVSEGGAAPGVNRMNAGKSIAVADPAAAPYIQIG